MKHLVYPGAFRHEKLYRELRAAVSGDLSLSEQGILLIDSEAAQGVVVSIEDQVDERVVQVVIAAHDPTTPDAVEAAETAAAANERTLQERAEAAVQTNVDALNLPDPTDANTAYLGHAAIPAGTLTAAQLSVIARTLSDQVDSLTRQNNAVVAQVRALTKQNTTLIRLLLGLVDDTAGTLALNTGNT